MRRHGWLTVERAHPLLIYPHLSRVPIAPPVAIGTVEPPKGKNKMSASDSNVSTVQKTSVATSKRGRATRERIIEIAEELIARHGPDGFQLQNVTERLGITPPAMYNHFRDRDDLVAHIAEKGSRELATRMRREEGVDTLESLRRNARRYVAFLVEHPAHARIILWDMARRGTTGWDGLVRTNIETSKRLASAFAIAAEKGEIRPVRVEAYLQFLFIGAAAGSVWTEYPTPPAENGASTTAADAEPPLPEHTPEEIEQLQNEAEDLVVRLLSPHLVDARS